MQACLFFGETGVFYTDALQQNIDGITVQTTFANDIPCGISNSLVRECNMICR